MVRAGYAHEKARFSTCTDPGADPGDRSYRVASAGPAVSPRGSPRRFEDFRERWMFPFDAGESDRDVALDVGTSSGNGSGVIALAMFDNSGEGYRVTMLHSYYQGDSRKERGEIGVLAMARFGCVREAD
jgi:hypothetical protein